MISLPRSSSRWFPLILIMAFMLLTTPTPSLEMTPHESVRNSASQGIEYNPNMLVRKSASVSESKRFSSHSSLLLFILCVLSYRCVRSVRAFRALLRPQIARRLSRLLLFPIKITSVYV